MVVFSGGLLQWFGEGCAGARLPLLFCNNSSFVPFCGVMCSRIASSVGFTVIGIMVK